MGSELCAWPSGGYVSVDDDVDGHGHQVVGERAVEGWCAAERPRGRDHRRRHTGRPIVLERVGTCGDTDGARSPQCTERNLHRVGSALCVAPVGTKDAVGAVAHRSVGRDVGAPRVDGGPQLVQIYLLRVCCRALRAREGLRPRRAAEPGEAGAEHQEHRVAARGSSDRVDVRDGERGRVVVCEREVELRA